MKKKNILTTILSLGLIISCNSADDNSSETEFEVGDIGPAGGFIFYDAGNSVNGWRYIEAAPNDIEGSEWGCFNSPVTDARNLNIGTGLENSIAIVEFHDSFNDFYSNPNECSDISNGTVAAKSCLDYEVNGFDNWHLPSEKEMLLMYENLHLNGIGEFEENDKLYWTSTEHDDNTATATDFSNGDQGWQCKQCDFDFMNIRAVRYF
jgi:hypothetical protein